MSDQTGAPVTEPVVIAEDAPIKGLPSVAEIAAKMSGGTAGDPNIPEQVVNAIVEEVGNVVEESPSEKKAEDAPKPVRDPAGSKFAALARKEKDIQRREKEMDRRLKEMEARTGAITEKETRVQQFKQDPLAAMKSLGMSYADITQAVLGNYKAPEEDPMDAKLKPVQQRFDKYESDTEKLTRTVEELKSQLAAKEQREQYAVVINGIKDASSDTSKYELIHAMGDDAIDLVKDTMVEYWNQHQKMLDYSEACDIVEGYYEENFLSKLAKTKKLGSRLAPAAAPKAAAPKSSAPREVKEPRTLNNRLSSAPEANVDIDKLPKHEALAYLAKKLQFID